MIPEPGVVPSALAEPTVRVRGGWTAAVVLANVGVFAAWLGPIQVLLAKQSEAVAPGNKEFVFGLVTGVGAAVSVVANPAFGAISDRTTSRYGRRVPWVVAGAVGGAIGLAILSGAHVIALMLIGWCLMQLFGNALLAAATAVVPGSGPVDAARRRRRVGRHLPGPGRARSGLRWQRRQRLRRSGTSRVPSSCCCRSCRICFGSGDVTIDGTTAVCLAASS